MANYVGKDTVVKLDNTAGTLTTLSTYFDRFNLPQDTSMHETTGYGATSSARTFLPGLTGSDSIGIGGKWDPTLDLHMSNVRLGLAAGGSLSFEFGPAGSTTGLPKYTGECFLEGYAIDDPFDDVITWSGSLKLTGALTRSTY